MYQEPFQQGWQPDHDDPQVVLSLLRLQSTVLEAITRNQPLQSVLDLLCVEAEKRIGDAIASVMMLDENSGKLSLAAAPSLPEQAWPALTNLDPSETAGSCGNAIFRSEPVYVCDVPEDTRWDDLRELAQTYSIGACWSYPVFLQSNKPSATFAITSLKKREPDTKDDLLLRVGAHLVGLALSFSRQHTLLQQMDAAMQTTAEGVCFFDMQRSLFMCNDAFSKMVGYPQEVLREMDLAALIQEEDREVLLEEIRSALNGFSAWRGELELLRSDGTRIPVLASINRISNPATGKLEQVAVVTNIEQLKGHAERLEYLLEHDALTGLFNRRGLEKSLHRLIADTGPNEYIAVVYLDLDRFKNINDTFGHKIGDQVLQLMAQRLKNALPDALICRQGGDQFLLVFNGLQRDANLSQIMDHLLMLSREPMTVGLSEFLFTATAGMAVYPDDAALVEELLSCADTALHEAKKQGRNHWLPYNQTQSRKLNRTLDIEHALRKDLMGNQQAFKLVYQLLYHQDQAFGMEALLRWSNETLGDVSPGEFIPLAEETGLIRELGMLVLRRACEDFGRLSETWKSRLRLAVNLSRMQLTSDLVMATMDILHLTGFDPAHLELEITETANLESGASHRSIIQKLQEHGIRFALDDFGTGYSSLTELKSLPVSVLKVDQTLTRDILEDPSDVALVRAALALGEALGLEVVAEGVENAEQLRLLKRLGCNRFQGYHFCRPMDMDSLLEKLAGHS